MADFLRDTSWSPPPVPASSSFESPTEYAATLQYENTAEAYTEQMERSPSGIDYITRGETEPYYGNHMPSTEYQQPQSSQTSSIHAASQPSQIDAGRKVTNRVKRVSPEAAALLSLLNHGKLNDRSKDTPRLLADFNVPLTEKKYVRNAIHTYRRAAHLSTKKPIDPTKLDVPLKKLKSSLENGEWNAFLSVNNRENGVRKAFSRRYPQHRIQTAHQQDWADRMIYDYFKNFSSDATPREEPSGISSSLGNQYSADIQQSIEQQ
jgi:hypothetical protein